MSTQHDTRLQDWAPLIKVGALHRAQMGSHARTLSDWNVVRYSQNYLPLSILIVSDNSAERFAIREALLTYGLRNMVEVRSTLDALSFLNDNQPDVVLVGMVLKEMSGLKFITAVRGGKQVLRKRVPIIAVLRAAMDYSAKKAHGLGIDSVIQLPISPLTLFNSIRQTVQQLPELQHG